jgi:hypothetical protein
MEKPLFWLKKKLRFQANLQREKYLQSMSSAQVKNINTYVTRFIAENGTDEMLDAWNSEENTKSFNAILLSAAKSLTSKSEKVKDPNKPKQGMSAYLFFCAASREDAKKQLGEDAKPNDVLSRLGEMWGELKKSKKSADQKRLKGFEEQAVADKLRYQEELAKYEPSSEEETTKRKSSDKVSNAPKRGKSAYLFFCAEKRQEAIARLGGDAKGSEVMTLLGQMWNELKEDEERESEFDHYKKLAEEDKARFTREVKDSSEEETSPKATKAKSAPKAKADSGKKMTGYVHFCQQHREAVKQANTGMKAGDVNKELSRMWKELDEETQAQWKTAASNL